MPSRLRTGSVTVAIHRSFDTNITAPVTLHFRATRNRARAVRTRFQPGVDSIPKLETMANSTVIGNRSHSGADPSPTYAGIFLLHFVAV